MQPILEVKNVAKDFTPTLSLKDFVKLEFHNQLKTRALDNISFSLNKGVILGILGPNGAGKTTLLKIISTLILPDKGKIFIKNFDVARNEDKIKSLVGLVLSAERSFYWRLTGRQNLDFFAELYGLSGLQKISKIKNILDFFNVDYQDRRFDSYSTGMQQKFSIMRSLLHDPELLLFDEPTKSLDYLAAFNLRQFIKEEIVKINGKTVIFTTHHMDEAMDFADIFMILDRGKIFGFGTLEELRRKTDKPDASLGEIFIKLTKEK